MMQPEALACTTEAAMPIYFYTKQTPMRQTGRHHGVEPTPRTQWRARDGGLITVFGVPRTEASWRTLMEWMAEHGMGQELRGEPRYQEAFVGGARSGPELQRVWESIGELIGCMDADEAYHGAQRRGYPWGLIRSPEDTLEDPHLWDRGFFTRVEHPELSRSYIYPGPPYILNKTPWRIRRRAPLVGEDNSSIYTQELGYSQEELAGLREAGVI